MDNNKINRPQSPSKLSSSFSTTKNSKPMTNYNKSASTPSVITGAEKITQTTVKPKNRKRFFIILIAVVLSILVAVSFVLILISPRAVRPSDISLDFKANIDFTLKDDLGIVIGEGDLAKKQVMPGDKIDYTFELYTQTNEQTDTSVNLDVFLRIKASMLAEDNYFANAINLSFTDNGQWYKGGDGYYYLRKTGNGDTSQTDGVLSPNEKISITRSMEIDKRLGNEYAGKEITILFDAEVLQAQYQAIFEIWPTAPYEWARQYKNLTW